MMEIEDNKESRVLDCATLWKLDDAIILIRFNEGFNLNLNDAVAVGNAGMELAEGGKYMTLIDVRNIGGSFGKEASEYFAKNEKLVAHRMAQAIVVNTLALKLIVRFYIKLSQPEREAQIFSNLEEAMKWLETKKSLLN